RLALWCSLRSPWCAALGTLIATVTVVIACATAAFIATEHLHFIGDDVGTVALHAFLVGVLVGTDRAFDINLTALFQVLAGDFGESTEHLDAMPFGALLL